MHHLPAAPVIRIVTAREAGFVAGVATRDIGLAVVALGGGRTKPQDGIDAAVGFTGLKRVGDAIGAGSPLGTIHARDATAADRAEAALHAAYRIGTPASGANAILRDRIG